MSTFGTFTISGTSVTGTANKVTGYTEFNKSDPNEQEGYYLPLTVEPWEGAQVRTARNPEKWVSLVDDANVILFLGKDAPSVAWYEVKDADGTITRYSVDITAAAPVRLNTRRKIAKK